MYFAKQRHLMPYKWTTREFKRLEKLKAQNMKELDDDMVDKYVTAAAAAAAAAASAPPSCCFSCSCRPCHH